MRKGLLFGSVALAAIGIGSCVGYVLMADSGLREKLSSAFHEVKKASQTKVSGMSEEVAARTAQVTRNPHINQEWVAQQWESVGY